ncbi:MAG: UDP-2,4-diacetamido-2,4,6-trideoxy-beta-L-altropyranose hydrolase [Proteobacteria bacterium]|nr:UDP-2,4-diacetamido-2,4,6-trideoxy-beta-L-altropyranose hydrolase [Pseudomonadota bacterium]
MACSLTIRADGDARMGTGHVMRMLALAQAWATQSEPVRFVGRIEAGPLRELIIAGGFSLTVLNAVHPDPADMAVLLEQSSPDGWVALDGYHLDSGYQCGVRAAGRKSFVVDDTCDRDAYDANVYLNQNIGAEELSPKLSPDALKLLGPRYALLRQEFRAVRQTTKPCPKRARNIMVTFGGSDPGNVSSRVLQALACLADPSLHVLVVAGAANPHAEFLRPLAAALPCTCEVLQAVTDMPGLMAWAELAISAAGSTCWELCYFGVPMLITSVADNQDIILTELVRSGAAQAFPPQTRPEELASALGALVTDAALRQSMHETSQRLVDGHGAERVVRAMRSESISLRPARPEDAETLLFWRNHPSIVAQSFSPDLVTPESHARWFASRLADPDCLLFIAEDSARAPIGQIRFDIQDDSALLSISVAPQCQKQGFGTAMTRRACSMLLRDRPSLVVQALVKPQNTHSKTMFESVGFSQGIAKKDFAHPHLLFELKGGSHAR